MRAKFRDFVPSIDEPRFPGYDLDANTYSDMRLEDPFNHAMFAAWSANADQPFCGVTTDGTPDLTLFPLQEEGAPVGEMMTAARAMLALASSSEVANLRLSLDSVVWRKWSNPEIYVNRHGLRLDEIGPALRNAILRTIRASLSTAGYEKARDCMYVNGFLGRLVWAPSILNEFSYNFTLFGEPSLTEPWGWQLNGHHLVMNCIVIGSQMVLSPCFWAAEPNEVDEGPRKGLTMFRKEEEGGLAFMTALPPKLRDRALLYAAGADSIPQSRCHPADHLHLAGAGQDNRVIAYEGVAGRDMSASQKRQLLDLIELYHLHFPNGTKNARMSVIESHAAELHFCWIGGLGPDDPFYYRIQGPTALAEFDHHAGVFLKNTRPEKFHIHTLLRTPNGNDYGMALIRQRCAARASSLGGVSTP